MTARIEKITKVIPADNRQVWSGKVSLNIRLYGHLGAHMD